MSIIEFLKKNRKVIIGVGLVLLVVVVVVAFWGGSSSADTAFQTEAVKRGDLAAFVGATGTVRARQSATLMWQTSGTVDAVNVQVGDRVKHDDVLASLDRATVSQNIIAAEADMVSAQRALDDLLNSDTARSKALIALNDAKDAYKKAYDYRESLNGEIDIKRVVYMERGGQLIPQVKYYKGLADDETIADADNKLALAKAQLEDAQRAYDRLKDGPNPDDVAAAEARVAAAKATLNMARIIAPFDGTITQAQPVVGDLVNASSAAFRIDDTSHLQVDVSISEVDINSVSIGQGATLSFDAVFGKEYHGEVMSVGQAGDPVSGVVNFKVTVEVTDADEQVKPGMTAAVSIMVNEVKDVLLIPNRAIRSSNGDRIVYLLKDGQPVRTKIRIGASSDMNSVLLDGDVKEGDLIILNPSLLEGGPFGG